MNSNTQPMPGSGSAPFIAIPKLTAAKPFRVVIAEDDEASRDLLQYLLGKWGFDCLASSDGLEAWDMLKEIDQPTLAILDWVMPGLSGVELCRRIRNLGCRNYTYILMLTAKRDRADVIESLRSGADDYLTKPFDAAELQARLLVAERTLTFQHELVIARDMLAQEAQMDYLTGLLNRRGVIKNLERELSRKDRTHEPFSIILADVDHFKQINDTYGHEAGDKVLQEVANRLSPLVRAHDSIGRYGGEEFLLVLTGCDHGSALVAAEKFRERICERPFSIAGNPVNISISLGVTTCVQLVSSQGLINIADSALYDAKSAGRNCTRVAYLAN